jgi:hypothetical protein
MLKALALFGFMLVFVRVLSALKPGHPAESIEYLFSSRISGSRCRIHITFGRRQKRSFTAADDFDHTVRGLRKPAACGTHLHPFKQEISQPGF